jgi:hypothetical protein
MNFPSSQILSARRTLDEVELTCHLRLEKRRLFATAGR